MKLQQMSVESRLKILNEQGLLTPEAHQHFKQISSGDLADRVAHCVEQMVGTFGVPIGIVEQVPINDDLVPVIMAVEESGIIQGVNSMSKLVRECGELRAARINKGMIGQIFYEQDVFFHIESYLLNQKELIIADANSDPLASVYQNGGGLKDLWLRQLDEQTCVVEVLVDTADAMGCRTINRLCYWLKERIAKQTRQVANWAAMSNSSDQQLYQAEVFLHGQDEKYCNDMVRLLDIANSDVRRAVNVNKSIMNGFEAILMATGNDCRAASASAHAYAARHGVYEPLLHVSKADGGMLYASLTMPVVAATVGGITGVHTTAAHCRDVMRIKTSDELALRAVSCGLLSSLATMKELIADKVAHGKERSYCKNLALQLDVSPGEYAKLVSILDHKLSESGRVTMADAKQLLMGIRADAVL